MNKVFIVGSTLLIIPLLAALAVYVFPDLPRQLAGLADECKSASYYSSYEYRQAAIEARDSGDLKCAVKLMEKVVEKRPNDVPDLGNLAMLLAMAERYQESMPYFEKYVKLGGGALDTFAWYADAFRQLDQIQPAINWYYRALSVSPNAYDVTEDLAELLALQGRPYEAINILTGFEEITDQPGYYRARKLTLQMALDSHNHPGQVFRIPKLNQHFYIASRLAADAEHPDKAFMVDTGASLLTMDEGWLTSNEVNHKVIKKRVRAVVANGDRISAKLVKIPYFKLGPFELNDVNAVVCDGCQPLIGQNVLEHFDMSTVKVNGVEFLYLERRGG